MQYARGQQSLFSDCASYRESDVTGLERLDGDEPLEVVRLPSGSF